jgi:predicted AAA+ superfamily ATPase
MLLTVNLKQIIDAQKTALLAREPGLIRESLKDLPDLRSHALIVSGIRRCGKSTLLLQMLNEKYNQAVYLNFEDPRLYDFERNDFTRLDEVIREFRTNVLLFDEIQIVPEWERYARQKLDEGYKLVITGSNASLLSRELGTKLTGRHVTQELFPFSYREFCSFRKLKSSADSLQQYLDTGGFPEYVKSGRPEILNQLFDDILLRDIAVRYSIRDIKTLQRLALYLVSNTANLITGNKLRAMFEIGSTSTIMEYLSYLEDSWLLQFVPKFSHSLKKQLINPRKVYAIDTGFVRTNSGSFSDDHGRLLENLVWLHLRRHYREIYYFAEKKECDFLIFEKGKPRAAIQVCFDLTPDNLDREIKGLTEAMNTVKLKQGYIITLKQKDLIEKEGLTINVLPCHEYMELGVPIKAHL